MVGIKETKHRMKKIVIVISVLFGVFMANSGISKFTGHMPVPELPQAGMELMGAMIASGWLMALVGIAEIVGGILVAIPRTQALGAIVLLPVIIGILLFNAFLAPNGVVMAAILMAMNCLVLWANKHKYKPMTQLETT